MGEKNLVRNLDTKLFHVVITPAGKEYNQPLAVSFKDYFLKVCNVSIEVIVWQPTKLIY